MGYPEPKAASSLPQLRLVLNGISCARVTINVRHGVSQLRDLSFTPGNGSSLTKRLFILKVRELLSEAGLHPSLYSARCFRIGVATSAAQAGLKDSISQDLGRWSSVAFLVYIHMSRSQRHIWQDSHKNNLIAFSDF